MRYADGGKPIKKVAICTGSGASLLHEIGDADVFITGEAKHNDFIDAAAMGVTLITAGHYETEMPVVPVIAKKLSLRFPAIETIDIKQENPVKFTEE